jgi:predicted TIM-barrel fold metal-dependent hydrolase
MATNESTRAPTAAPNALAAPIDTHQYVIPTRYASWPETHGVTAGGLRIPPWTTVGAPELMELIGIQAALLSVWTPDVNLGDDAQARTMARDVNECAARGVDDHRTRFRFFATLTLPDIDRALAELTHAFDVLGAAGVVLLANVQGTYLGGASLEPLIEDLDRRAAVLFVHPAPLPAEAVTGIPPYAADFLLDTTRAAINMTRAGWREQYSRLKFILSHGGGLLPYAAERVAPLCSPLRDADDGLRRLRRYHLDTSLARSRYALPSLLALAEPARITFGSDTGAPVR